MSSSNPPSHSDNETACVCHFLQVDRVQNSTHNFDLDLRPLTYDLDFCDLDLRDIDLVLGPPFQILGWKLAFLQF